MEQGGATAGGTARPHRDADRTGFLERHAIRARRLVEYGLLFVFLEALLRRMMPEWSLRILAFKFAYFPLVYLLAYPVIRDYVRTGFLPRGTMAFYGWGMILSLITLPSNPFAHGMGIIVNVLFIPLAFAGAALYADDASVARLLRLLTLFGAAAGLLALVQSRLPANSWLNVSMDAQSGAADMGFGLIRVSSTFQFCNVFGSFVIFGLIAGFGWMQLGGRIARAVAVPCMSLLYLGGLYSGSRMASFNAILVLLACYCVARNGLKVLLVTLLIGSLSVGAVILFASNEVREMAYLSDSRVFSSDVLIQRIRELYFGEVMENAWHVSKGVGLGWGPYTMGVDRYSEVFGGDSLSDEYYVEGGYGVIFAHTGMVGITLFVLLNMSLLFDSLWMRTQVSWMGVGLALWSLLGNLPLSLQELPVLAIPWWLCVGIYLRHRLVEKCARSVRNVEPAA